MGDRSFELAPMSRLRSFPQATRFQAPLQNPLQPPPPARLRAPRGFASAMPRWLVLTGLVLAGGTLLEPATALAGPYLDAVRVQQACRSIGELGASAFQARPSTAGIMTRFELRSAAQVWLQQMNTLHPIPEGREGRIIRATAMHAFTAALSPQDAYDYGWARCMDAYGPPPPGTAPFHRPSSTGRLR